MLSLVLCINNYAHLVEMRTTPLVVRIYPYIPLAAQGDGEKEFRGKEIEKQKDGM